MLRYAILCKSILLITIGFQLAGCQTLLTAENFNALENSVIQEAEEANTRVSQRVAEFYQRNPDYERVARAVEEANINAGFYNLEAQKLLSAANVQKRFPQIRPSISLDQNGIGVARLLVDQILFSNGRLKAGKIILNAQEAQAIAQYRMEANENVAQALVAYLDFVRYRETVAAADEVLSFYRRFEEMALARVEGGVANRTELRLFELKRAQAAAEKKEFIAELRRANTELELLTESEFEVEGYSRIDFASDYQDVDGDTSLIKNDPILYTPEYRIALATLNERIAERKMAHAERIPELKLVGGFGLGSSQGLLSNNSLSFARLVFDGQNALNWGENLELDAREAQVLAAEATVEDRRRQINIALKSQNALIDSLVEQLDAKSGINDLAQQRAESFSEDFLAGAVGLLEVVSVLETVKSVKFEAISTEYLLHVTEVEKAAAIGVLGPFPLEIFAIID